VDPLNLHIYTYKYSVMKLPKSNTTSYTLIYLLEETENKNTNRYPSELHDSFSWGKNKMNQANLGKISKWDIYNIIHIAISCFQSYTIKFRLTKNIMETFWCEENEQKWPI
jgi:hypothetical protein